MSNRAYSLFELKSFDLDKRQLTGVASTPAADRVGDIVEPKGAQFNLPIPLLWQHDSAQPIGQVTDARVTSKGIEVSAKLAKTDTPGKLKDRLDEAWESLKIGLVRGLSIGFRALESEPTESGFRFAKWEWLELSAVTIPANAEASIAQVKFFDQNQAGDDFHDHIYSDAMLTGAKTFMDEVGRMSPTKQAWLNQRLVAAAMTATLRCNKLARQLNELSREKSQPSLAYRGVWDAKAFYQPGDFVTHGGSVWHCNALNADSRPGTGGDWTLAVKKGKDGRG